MTGPDTKWRKIWRESWKATFYLTALSPLLLWLLCCGGCVALLVGAFDEIRDGYRKLSALHEEQELHRTAMRTADASRQNSLRNAAIDAAKRALAERGSSQVADRVSAEQDDVDMTRWLVKGQVLVSERLLPFTVVLKHATFNNVDHWDVESVNQGGNDQREPALPLEHPEETEKPTNSPSLP